MTPDTDKLAQGLALVESIRTKARAMLEECDRLEVSLRAQYGVAEPFLSVAENEARRSGKRVFYAVSTDGLIYVRYSTTGVCGAGHGHAQGSTALSFTDAVQRADVLAATAGYVRVSTTEWRPRTSPSP